MGDEDKKKKWYVALGPRWKGPLSTHDILEGVKAGDWAWVDHIWGPGQGLSWARICNLKEFKEFLPVTPDSILIQQFKLRAEAAHDIKAAQYDGGPGIERPATWFVEFSGSKFGPFSNQEVLDMWKQGKIKGQAFAWREGTPDWRAMEEVIAELSAGTKTLRPGTPAAQAAAHAQARGERRKRRRAPFLATVAFKLNGRISVGAGRDISVQGMKILMQTTPPPVGSRISLTVEPKEKIGVHEFTVEAVVLHVLSAPAGFCVKFENPEPGLVELIDAFVAARAGR